MNGTFGSSLSAADDARFSRTFGGVTWGLILSAVLLSTIGVGIVNSASSELAVDYLPRQVVWVLLGLVALGLGTIADYHLLMRIATPLYLLSLGSLALILIIGHEAGGARSWIGIAGFGGQPSDFAKLATAILLARYLGGIRLRFLELRHLIGGGAIVGLPMLLVALEPDLGGAVMFAPIFAGMVLVAGVRARTLAQLALVGVLAGGAVWTFGMQDYQRERVLTFVSPERDPQGAGYQVRQSKIAVGSGGLLGKGYMQGTQSQLRFLPARHTDFVFAVLAEEAGFVGVLGVLGLYLVFLSGGLRIAIRARDRSGILLAVGLLSALAVHVVYNTAMVIGLVPVTGIPIPFLSYGGSFTLFCFFTTGILLGVDIRRYVNRTG